MKNIEINEKQKENLLEMCKELFPELNLEMYYDKDIADNWEEALKNDSCGNDAQIGYLISNWHKPNAKIIHWFEFCMTHLFYKLYYNGWRKENPNCVVDFHLDLHNFKYHPVDYLYKEFKKLKNDN